MSKILMVFSIVLFLSFGAFYFSSNQSYQNSLTARVYFFVNNYEQAYEYAKKAYEKDKYNKMAFSILTQSSIALSYKNYLKNSQKYLEQIENISKKKDITKADTGKIQLICELMIDEYEELKSSKLVNDELKSEAVKMQDRFKQINEELF